MTGLGAEIEKRGVLRIVSESGEVEFVGLEFTKADIQIFKNFCEDAWKLRSSSIFNEKGVKSFTLAMTPGERLSVEGDEIDKEAWDAATLRLRPFILEKEPWSYWRVSSLLGKKIDNDRARAQLKAINAMFQGKAAPYLMEWKIGDKRVTIDDLFKMWMNAFVYHRDQEKRDFINAINGSNVSYDAVLYHIYFHAVEKLRAVMYLAKFVIDILGDSAKSAEWRDYELEVMRSGDGSG